MGVFKDIGDWFRDLGRDSVSREEELELIKKLAAMETDERNRLDEIARKYGEASRPADKEFEYKEDYVPIDEETLREKSKSEYSGAYGQEKDQTNAKYQEKYDKETQKEEGYKKDAEDKSNYYEKQFKNKNDSFKSAASKNGIADSSITSAKKDDLEKQKEEYIEEVMTALKKKLNISDSNKDAILEEKNSKLTALDEKFKKDVENLFNKLMSEEDKKVKDVENYNKDTAKKEKEYKEYQDKVVKEKTEEMKNEHNKMKEDEMSGTFSDLKREEDYKKRLDLATDFYSKFAKKSALEYIQSNDSLRKLMGPYYLKLIRNIQNA